MQNARTGHYTLGDNIVPKHYELLIEPNLKTFVYKGLESISVEIKRPIKLIKLNSKHISIKSAQIKREGSSQDAATISENAEREEITLVFKNPVSGNATIEIEFTGRNTDNLYGFYRSKYTYKGHDQYLLTTQMEPASARTAFPCFDEPAFKATFGISLLIDSQLDAISNMPKKSTTKKGSKKIITFRDTPRMSTYLVYMYVGKFERIATKVGGIDFGVVTVPGKIALAKMALDYGKRLFLVLRKYFDVGYPLPKMDLIAVPDFAAGAMENWGAITFREAALLGDEKTMSLPGKQRIAMIIAHELAHQWFGDLVTMAWWDDMWLNESFATFMAYKVVDRIFPEWRYMDYYREDVTGRGLVADWFINTHAISMKVDKPGQIEELFDDIGYEKGGSVLFMLENFVGTETFRKGLKIYLEGHEYSNAVRTDLWNAINEQSRKEHRNLPVPNLMRQWIEKKGHPVVSVSEVSNGYKVEQTRFTLSKTIADTWPVPISYNANGKTGQMLMGRRSAMIKADHGWIKLNYGQTSFYRTFYDTSMLEKLGSLVRSRELGEVDAWGIISDLYALARSARITLKEYSDFVGRYCHDIGYPANIVVGGNIMALHNLSEGKPFQNAIKQVATRYFRAKLKVLGWEKKPDEITSDTLVRSQAIASLGILGDGEVIGKTRSLFDGYAEGKPIPPDIKRATYAVVAYNSNDVKTFNRLAKLYRSERIPEEGIMALMALGYFRGKKLFTKALDFSLSNAVRRQDSFYIANAASLHSSLRWEHMKWLERNWKRLMERYTPDSKTLRDYASLFWRITEPEQYGEFKKFFSAKKNVRDDIKTELLQVSETIEANIKFIGLNGGY